MSEQVKKRFYEEQIVKKIVKTAVKTAIHEKVLTKDINKFLLKSLDDIIKKELGNDRTTTISYNN
jgi:hypothetical protein